MIDLTQPWIWYALGLALLWACLQLADWYMQHRPLTDDDHYCAAVDDDLNRQTTVLIGAQLDAVDPGLLELEHELIDDIEAWLRARNEYEERQS